jgi:L-fuculose-phosphate aldolase
VHPEERHVDRHYVDGLIDTTRRVLASGAIGANGHGNVSLRVAGADEMYFPSASSLDGLTADGIARVRLDGTLVEGQLPPIQGAVVDMHASRYRASEEIGCVLHTHSPFATAFAVALRPIECWIEAMAMFGLADGVSVAGYRPRGSAEAVASIDEAVRPGVPAVLLANHGVLVFHRSPELAVLVAGVVEEAAQAALNATFLGGPVIIPEDLRAAALQRTMAFAAAGTRSA